ncbi:ABC transporter permease [Terrimonas sp. NA20]|uniref:ABC transporter permease n=1 Tax=Terrimonas ginsenosidimutans TaxID=2908004 RepID=A0ABS9KM44_9BACT|nr:FtsX-like permease family protein [Terrimonas ginsenosidimutans]MCG2613388.1 ABC transporter permease [Terrimonas ginsenosidimutans]
MSTNFFTTTFRFLWKRKGFSFLNIFGLAIGIAASLMLFLIIRHELSYEDFQENKDRLYRVTASQYSKSNNEVSLRTAGIAMALPEALRLDFPQLENIGALWQIGSAQVYIPSEGIGEEKKFKEPGGMFWAEAGIFDMLSVKFIAGNAKALTEPNKAVITESLARKYFDNASNAIGKTVQLWSFRIPLQVVGVYQDLPSNTDIPIHFAGSFPTLKNAAPGLYSPENLWSSLRRPAECFVMAREGHQIVALQSQLNTFTKKYLKDTKDLRTELNFQPLASMHLDKSFETYGENGLSKRELWSLSLIGVFLLLVACINFINLTTAQSVNRAKEIGVRKVLGGNRKQLMQQFLQETALITFIAVVLGCILTWIFLPMMNTLMNKDLSLNFAQYPEILVYLFITATVVTLLAGIYPALVLSGFKPMMAFRSKTAATLSKGISLRRGLVVFQFVIAQLLIIGTFVVVKQMNYFRNQPMGFDKEGIVLINLPSDSTLKARYPALKAQMLQVSGVTNASLCMDAPTSEWPYTSGFVFDNDVEEKGYDIGCQLADTSYLSTFGIQLIAGRTLFQSDTLKEALVNELFVKKLGFKSPQDVIGKMIALSNWNRKIPIVGVIKDYNNKPFRDELTPLMITTEYNTYEWIAVRMRTDGMNATMEGVSKLFTSFYPTYLYDPVFLDERVERFYHNEALTAQLFKIFSFLAILISCFGLYGLVSFMAVQKTKEVGIRKVLGASLTNIVYMFSKEFTFLVIIAFIVAAPIAYYFMNNWLAGFHYHISIGAGVFILTILSSIVIAWLTVSYKALKGALVNPVKSLKTE